MTLARTGIASRALPPVALAGRFAPEALQLERSNGLLWSAFDTVETPVAVLDANGRILLVNASWRRLSQQINGARERDVTGADYLAVGLAGAIAPRHALALRIGLRKLLRGTAASFEHQACVKQAGTDRWYQVRATRVEAGGPIRVVVTHEDITALRGAEQAVKAVSQRLLTLQQQERQRIAAELHDSTCQQLTAASLHLGALRRTAQTDPLALEAIDQIGRSLGEAQKEIRSFSYLLHPPYLGRDGLRTTLMRFVEGYGRRTGLKATTQIADEVDGVVPAAQLALLRIVQEALSNVHRHARATKIAVSMKTTRTSLLFSIGDNGKGMGDGEMPGDRPAGLGVAGMRARVGQLGGTLRIASGARGTTISGKVPLSRCRP